MGFREQRWAPWGGALVAMALGLAPSSASTEPSPGRRVQELRVQLPIMTPRVVEWAEKVAAASLEAGSPITHEMKDLARASGVRHPERIRLRVVEQIPLPEEPLLRAAAGSVGVAQSSAAGMTLGYAVIVHRGYERDPRLLSHEFRHVAQYEQSGGIRAFLAIHLPHLLEFGYEDSPFEVDARAHEVQHLQRN